MITEKQRRAAASDRWRQKHPDKAREYRARWRAAHPLTAEQIARKAVVNRAWRKKNAAYIKREQKQRWEARRDQANALRRAKYAADPARQRVRTDAWKAAHPEHSRRFYARHREKFTGDGRWSKRTKRRKDAWRKFTHTCAATRAKSIHRETSTC